ncbi:MAG: excinuclease ABC subunit UvrC [Candidatus Goldbacteria bacterium]|nr:excinuclease ABC subunit UvrC [Candidatus Goldiibacteriota bacterium]
MKETDFKHKLETLPEKPGVYIFKDSNGKIIYIGKAKSLKKRILSYFNKTRKDIKTDKLAEKIKDFDYIVTNNEIEAFLLEGTLVKQHKPHYNILLKDDKTFPFIKITVKEKYPGVYFTRNTKDKNAIYYGPYFADDARKVLELIYKIFKVRQCNYNFDKKKLTRPCVFYDSNLCSAPCVGFINDIEYQSSIKQVKKFLNGSYKNILKELNQQMMKFSEKREYEKAAEIRDEIKALKSMMQKQTVVLSEDKNVDVINYSSKDQNNYFCVLNIRSGRLISKKIDVFGDIPDNEGIFESYLMQYYSRNISYPDEIILSANVINQNIINEFFKRKNIKVVFKKRDNLLDMAAENIREKIKQDEKDIAREKMQKEAIQKQLIGLKDILSMKKIPEVIDAIDVSHFSGDNIVASCVVFKNGLPEKKLYRRYKIKKIEKIDDYAAIREVVMRRYSRMLKENEKFPDLILIDGGLGHVNAAKQGLDMIGVENICIIGLAKKKEEIFLPQRSIPIDIPAENKLLLQKIRDEAHRFAVTYQTLLANKKLKKTIFDNIPYIGEKTRYNIYSIFKDRDDLISAIEKNDKRADFLTEKQKKEIMKKLKGEQDEI